MSNRLDNSARQGNELLIDELGVDTVELHQIDFNPIFTFTYSGNLGIEDTAYRLYNDTGSARTFKFVRASVGSTPTGSYVLVDVKMNGTSIFNQTLNLYGTVPLPDQRLVLQEGDYTVTSTPLDGLIWAPNDYLTVSIQHIGTTFAGADLTINVVVAE
jgi:hypothetical protein